MMKKTPRNKRSLLLACFGGGDQSELIREIDSHEGSQSREERPGVEGTNGD